MGNPDFYQDCALLPSRRGLFPDMGNLFLVGSSVFLPMVIQQLAATVGLSQEEMGTLPSTLPSGTERI